MHLHASIPICCTYSILHLQHTAPYYTYTILDLHHTTPTSYCTHMLLYIQQYSFNLMPYHSQTFVYIYLHEHLVAGRQKQRRRQRAQQLPVRSSSPYNGYSTDSSVVFVPRKPYPKSQRRKQMNTKPSK